jgi:hypothetical protein
MHDPERAAVDLAASCWHCTGLIAAMARVGPADEAVHSRRGTARCAGPSRNSATGSTPSRPWRRGKQSLDAAAWDREGVWVRSDLLPGNLIVIDDHLRGVIDWVA